MLSKPLIIGIDLGTTHVRSAAYDAQGTCVALSFRELPRLGGVPGRAEQDPERVLGSTLDTLADVVIRISTENGRAVGVCLGTAMHGLIGLDAHGRSITPLVTWADTRAVRQAERLRADAASATLLRRTGAPLHAMTPLAKLLWFREEEPDTFAHVHRWASPKELLLLRLLGSDAVDHSVAGATGLFDLERADWNEEALALAGVRRDQLGVPIPTTHVLRGLAPEIAASLGLAADTPIVIGASDGALANLGAGALGPDIAACTVGTSGAVRVTLDAPRTDPHGRLFCYPLAPGRWIAGGAVNDGGIALRWLRDALLVELGDAARARGVDPYDALTELAARAPDGADGLLFLPGLSGERAPQRSPSARGVLFGLTLAHDRAHVVRAVMEGVMLQLSGVARMLAASGLPVRQVRASGGFTRSRLWRQIMADTFAAPVAVTADGEASLMGAALLGMVGLGMLGSLEEAAALVRVTEEIHPSPDAAREAGARYARFERIARTLDPLFEELASG